MSWHNSAILAQADFSDNFLQLFTLLGLKNALRRPDLDSRLGDGGDRFSDGLGLRVFDGWTCVFGAEVANAIIGRRLSPLAARANLLAWSLEGTCGYGCYQWWTGGTKVREWEEMEGKVLIDFGLPLFGGDEVAPDDLGSEDRVFRAMAALAIPLEKLWNQPLAAYVTPRNRFREWLRRSFRI